jgi:hypothetical protein
VYVAERLGVAHVGRTQTTKGQHGKVDDNKVAAAISKVGTCDWHAGCDIATCKGNSCWLWQSVGCCGSVL